MHTEETTFHQFKQLDSLKYTVAGSKYHLYRLAFGHPDYQTLRDDDFYYNFCPRRNISTTKKMGELTIFERKLAAFDVRIPQKDDDKSGIYLESLSKNPLQRWDINRQHVTLTDNMTFAFLTICWTGADQRAWEVISADDKLDLQAKKRVMEHAESLGFRKENFVFLRPDSCVKVAH